MTLALSAVDRAKTPVLLAPSMNDVMWSQPATRRNVRTLEEDGYALVRHIREHEAQHGILGHAEGSRGTA